jgi:hypothetical protein
MYMIEILINTFEFFLKKKKYLFNYISGDPSFKKLMLQRNRKFPFQIILNRQCRISKRLNLFHQDEISYLLFSNRIIINLIFLTF